MFRAHVGPLRLSGFVLTIAHKFSLLCISFEIISIHALRATQVTVAFSRFQQQQLHISGGEQVKKLAAGFPLEVFHSLQKRPSYRASVIAGIVAAVLFVGAVASNWIANDLQQVLEPYRRWVAIHHAEQALTIFEQIEDPRAAKVRAQLAVWREQTNT